MRGWLARSGGHGVNITQGPYGQGVAMTHSPGVKTRIGVRSPLHAGWLSGPDSAAAPGPTRN